MMYEIWEHYYGRPMIKSGPMSGCYDLPRHKWVRLNKRLVGLKRAIKTAKNHPFHCAVSPPNSTKKTFDNGKSPGLPDGWIPPLS